MGIEPESLTTYGEFVAALENEDYYDDYLADPEGTIDATSMDGEVKEAVKLFGAPPDPRTMKTIMKFLEAIRDSSGFRKMYTADPPTLIDDTAMALRKKDLLKTGTDQSLAAEIKWDPQETPKGSPKVIGPDRYIHV